MPILATPLCTADITVKHRSDGGTVSPIRCKRWSCPHCHERNRRDVIRKAIEGKPRSMMTLTVNSKNYDCPDDAAADLKKGLRLLRLSLKRHPRLRNFEFIAVFEQHESGWPHLHLLCRAKYIPWRWLRQRWKSVTGSYQLDIRKIKGGRDAARYVAKYIGKDLSPFAHCKRWWRSHGYAPKEEETEEQEENGERWLKRRVPLEMLAGLLRSQHFQLSTTASCVIQYTGPPDDPRHPYDIWDEVYRYGYKRERGS